MRRLASVALLAVAAWGQGVPDIHFTMLNGKTVALSELTSKGPVVIDFWALWCAPCLKFMPQLDALQSAYGDRGLSVVAVNLDSEKSRSKVRSHVRSRKFGFSVAMDPSQEIFRRLNGNSMPYTLVITPGMEVSYRHVGFVPGDEERLKEEVTKLLSPTPAPSTEPGS